MPNFDVEVNAVGLSCPLPIMKCSKELKKLSPGQVLYLKASDPASRDDVNTLMDSTKDTLISSMEDAGVFHYYIKRN